MIGHVLKANSKAVVAFGLLFLAFSVAFAQEETTGAFSWQKPLLTSDLEIQTTHQTEDSLKVTSVSPISAGAESPALAPEEEEDDCAKEELGNYNLGMFISSDLIHSMSEIHISIV
jgi:hypothetical protein